MSFLLCAEDLPSTIEEELLRESWCFSVRVCLCVKEGKKVEKSEEAREI